MIVRHVISVSFKRQDEIVENDSVFSLELIRHVINTGGATTGCPDGLSSL